MEPPYKIPPVQMPPAIPPVVQPKPKEPPPPADLSGLVAELNKQARQGEVILETEPEGEARLFVQITWQFRVVQRNGRFSLEGAAPATDNPRSFATFLLDRAGVWGRGWLVDLVRRWRMVGDSALELAEETNCQALVADLRELLEETNCEPFEQNGRLYE